MNPANHALCEQARIVLESGQLLSDRVSLWVRPEQPPDPRGLLSTLFNVDSEVFQSCSELAFSVTEANIESPFRWESVPSFALEDESGQTSVTLWAKFSNEPSFYSFSLTLVSDCAAAPQLGPERTDEPFEYTLGAHAKLEKNFLLPPLPLGCPESPPECFFAALDSEERSPCSDLVSDLTSVGFDSEGAFDFMTTDRIKFPPGSLHRVHVGDSARLLIHVNEREPNQVEDGDKDASWTLEAPEDSSSAHLRRLQTCDSPTAIIPSQLVDQEYIITDFTKSYTFTAFTTNPPGCSISYAQRSSASAVISFDPANRLFKFFYVDDLLLLQSLGEKTYDITVSASSGNVKPIGTSASFKLTLKSPCGRSNMVKLNSLPFVSTPWKYKLRDPPQAFEYRAFQILTFPVTHTLCNQITYTATTDLSPTPLTATSSPVSIKELTQKFMVYLEDASIASITITLNAHITGWPDNKAVPATATIQIQDPCRSGSINVPLIFNEVVYRYESRSLPWAVIPFNTNEFNSWTTDPSYCRLTFSCEFITFSFEGSTSCDFVDGNTQSIFDPVLNMYQLRTRDMNLFNGVHYLQFTASLPGGTTSTTVATLEFVDPCPDTQFTIETPHVFQESLRYSLRDKPVAYKWDMASLFYVETLVDCGPFTLMFTTDRGDPIDKTTFKDDRDSIPAQFLVSYTEALEKVGVYRFTFKISLDNFPMNRGISLDQPFQISIIDPCDKPLWIRAPSELDGAVIKYKLLQPALSFTFEEFVPSPAWCDLAYFFDVPSPLAKMVFKTFDAKTRTFTFQYQEQDLLPLKSDFQLEFVDFDLLLGCQSGKALIAQTQVIMKLRVQNPCFDTLQKPHWCPNETKNLYLPGMPKWQSDLHDIVISIEDKKKKMTFDFGPKVNRFNSTAIQVTVKMEGATGFAFYNADRNALDVYSDWLNKTHLGYYRFEVVSTETVEGQTYSYSKTFYLKVVKPMAPDPTPIQPVAPTEYKRQVPDSDIILRETVTQDRPLPKVLELDPAGKMTIAWTRQMMPQGDAPIIENTKVKAYMQPTATLRRSLTDSESPQSYDRVVEVTVSEEALEQFSSRVIDLEALEVKIVNMVGETLPDMKPTWTVLAYQTNELRLQLKFKDTRSLDTQQQVSVTFWGTQLFKDANGQEVPFGAEVRWDIVRQIQLEDQPIVDDIMVAFLVLVGLSVAFALLIVLSCGSLLPFWMFINSMQLIAHVPLINSNLPGNSHFFLLENLKIFRLHFGAFNLWLKTLLGDHREEDAALVRDDVTPYYTTLLYQCGYSFRLWPNLILIFVLIVTTLTIWVLSFALDFSARCTCCKNRIRTNHLMSNFTVRLLYEAFFEIVLCLMINISFFEAEATSEKAALILCVCLAVLTLVALALICSNAWHRGPHVKGVYEKKSLLYMWGFGYRPLNRNHPAVASLLTALSMDKITIEDQLKSQDKPGGDDPENPVEAEKACSQAEFHATSIGERAVEAPLASVGDTMRENYDFQSIAVKSCDNFLIEGLSNQVATQDYKLKSPRSTGSGDKQRPPSKTEEVIALCIPDSHQSQFEGGEATEGALESSRRLIEADSCSSFGSSEVTSSQSIQKMKKHDYQAIYEYMKPEAQLKVQLESLVRVSDHYRTLFTGLKKNHQHSAAVVYPVIFLIRRIVYAAIVLFLVHIPSVAAYLLCWICVGMIGYILVEQQWEESLISRQHIVNEVALYLVVLIAFVSSAPLPVVAIGLLGWSLIAIVISTVVFNILVITYSFCIHGKKTIRNKRRRHRRRRRLGRVKKNKPVVPQAPQLSEPESQSESVVESVPAAEQSLLEVRQRNEAILSQDLELRVKDEDVLVDSQLVLSLEYDRPFDLHASVGEREEPVTQPMLHEQSQSASLVEENVSNAGIDTRERVHLNSPILLSSMANIPLKKLTPEDEKSNSENKNTNDVDRTNIPMQSPLGDNSNKVDFPNQEPATREKSQLPSDRGDDRQSAASYSNQRSHFVANSSSGSSQHSGEKEREQTMRSQVRSVKSEVKSKGSASPPESNRRSSMSEKRKNPKVFEALEGRNGDSEQARSSQKLQKSRSSQSSHQLNNDHQYTRSPCLADPEMMTLKSHMKSPDATKNRFTVQLKSEEANREAEVQSQDHSVEPQRDYTKGLDCEEDPNSLTKSLEDSSNKYDTFDDLHRDKSVEQSSHRAPPAEMTSSEELQAIPSATQGKAESSRSSVSMRVNTKADEQEKEREVVAMGQAQAITQANLSQTNSTVIVQRANNSVGIDESTNVLIRYGTSANISNASIDMSMVNVQGLGQLSLRLDESTIPRVPEDVRELEQFQTIADVLRGRRPQSEVQLPAEIAHQLQANPSTKNKDKQGVAALQDVFEPQVLSSEQSIDSGSPTSKGQQLDHSLVVNKKRTKRQRRANTIRQKVEYSEAGEPHKLVSRVKQNQSDPFIPLQTQEEQDGEEEFGDESRTLDKALETLSAEVDSVRGVKALTERTLARSKTNDVGLLGAKNSSLIELKVQSLKDESKNAYMDNQTSRTLQRNAAPSDFEANHVNRLVPSSQKGSLLSSKQRHEKIQHERPVDIRRAAMAEVSTGRQLRNQVQAKRSSSRRLASRMVSENDSKNYLHSDESYQNNNYSQKHLKLINSRSGSVGHSVILDRVSNEHSQEAIDKMQNRFIQVQPLDEMHSQAFNIGLRSDSSSVEQFESRGKRNECDNKSDLETLNVDTLHTMEFSSVDQARTQVGSNQKPNVHLQDFVSAGHFMRHTQQQPYTHPARENAGKQTALPLLKANTGSGPLATKNQSRRERKKSLSGSKRRFGTSTHEEIVSERVQRIQKYTAHLELQNMPWLDVMKEKLGGANSSFSPRQPQKMYSKQTGDSTDNLYPVLRQPTSSSLVKFNKVDAVFSPFKLQKTKDSVQQFVSPVALRYDDKKASLSNQKPVKHNSLALNPRKSSQYNDHLPQSPLLTSHGPNLLTVADQRSQASSMAHEIDYLGNIVPSRISRQDNFSQEMAQAGSFSSFILEKTRALKASKPVSNKRKKMRQKDSREATKKSQDDQLPSITKQQAHGAKEKDAKSKRGNKGKAERKQRGHRGPSHTTRSQHEFDPYSSHTFFVNGKQTRSVHRLMKGSYLQEQPSKPNYQKQMNNVRDMLQHHERCDCKNFYKCASMEELSQENSTLNQSNQHLSDNQLCYNNKDGFKEGLVFPIANNTNPPMDKKKGAQKASE